MSDILGRGADRYDNQIVLQHRNYCAKARVTNRSLTKAAPVGRDTLDHSIQKVLATGHLERLTFVTTVTVALLPCLGDVVEGDDRLTTANRGCITNYDLRRQDKAVLDDPKVHYRRNRQHGCKFDERLIL